MRIKQDLKTIYSAVRHFFHEIKAGFVYYRTHGFRTSLKHFISVYRRQLFWALVLAAIFLLLVPPLTYLYFARDLKDKQSITNRSKTGLTLLDRDGTEFFSFNRAKDIQYINLDTIPEPMQQAVISAEDKNFYTNSGFSLQGMARAFFANLFARRIVQGGSTITQELVKNALLYSSQTFLRKYQEIVLAYELNRRFSKNDILEMYLNSVYFGEGAFGVENAAQAYFGQHASELSLGQSALLVGLLPAPSAYDPLTNDPNRAIRRQKIVLSEMVKDGKITQAEADAAAAEEITYNPVKKETNVLAPHFAIYVRDYLYKKYGEEKVIRDGFTVTTTLNSTWQKYAERAVYNQIQNLQYNDTSNGAVVAIDPKTGQIETMVGSYDWTDEKFGKANMAVAPRQPGSSFKPIIYSNALEQHLITPATLLKDDPITYPGGYSPHDYDRKNRGKVTVRRALSNSLNIPAVEVMDQVGVSEGVSWAKNLGITTLNSPSKYGLSLVLGAAEVPLLEMTDAYAVFADQGLYNEPTAVLEIKDKYGKEVDKYEAKPKQAMSDGAAYLISSILSDNKSRAEEFGNALTISRTAAVKTGTTEDYRDALTIGYTPSLVVGVWVGNNDNSSMDNIAGSLGAAPIWRNLMNTFLAGTHFESFIKPSSVKQETVCITQGQSDKTASTSAQTEYFIQGTEPEGCDTPTPQQSPTETPKPSDKPTDTPTPQPQVTATPAPTAIVPTAVLPTAGGGVQGAQTTAVPTP